MRKYEITVHWIMWAGILFKFRPIIYTSCAFPRNWVPLFKLNTLKLVPQLPGSDLGPVLVRDT